MKFVLASQNPHKLRELQQILAPYGVELVLPSHLGLNLTVEETGQTFAENACLKASALMQASGLPAIGDDSGLQVDALQGAPGIYSARYGGERCKTDDDRNQLLLEQLKDVPMEARTARFVSCICCVFPDGRTVYAQGECPGRIALEPAGSEGFGYDPIFYLPTEQKTFAQLSQQRKNEISHRAKAIEKFYQLIQKEIVYADK